MEEGATGEHEEHKRSTRGAHEGTSHAPGLLMACPTLSPLKCQVEHSGIPGKISHARAGTCPNASLSIAYPRSSIFLGCGAISLPIPWEAGRGEGFLADRESDQEPNWSVSFTPNARLGESIIGLMS